MIAAELAAAELGAGADRGSSPLPVGIMREREPRGSSRNYCFCRLGLGTTEEVSSACAITAYTT